MIGLGWLAYVRTDYRDSTNNESHNRVYFETHSFLLIGFYSQILYSSLFPVPCSLLKNSSFQLGRGLCGKTLKAN